jgi:hypothetical protein
MKLGDSRFTRELLLENRVQLTTHHEQRWSGLAVYRQCLTAEAYRLLKISPPSGYHTECQLRFTDAHRRVWRSIRVNALPNDLASVHLAACVPQGGG